MLFLVHGRDGAQFDGGPDPDACDEAHQAYMDGWLPRLTARGPTLSEDGEQHTGSVHVVEVDDVATARRFASEEPYASCGWQTDVSVQPFLPAVTGTMWDRRLPDPERPAAFVRASWTPRPLEADDLSSLVRRLGPSLGHWLFAGLLLTDRGDRSAGFAGSIDLSTEQLRSLAGDALGVDAVVEVHRWRRGGR